MSFLGTWTTRDGSTAHVEGPSDSLPGYWHGRMAGSGFIVHWNPDGKAPGAPELDLIERRREGVGQ